MALQGVYLLTSIGLNITSETRFYPMATLVAAGVGLGTGAPLMAWYGATGAAIAFLLSYLTLAVVASAFSQRVYPVSYERGRLLRIVASGTIAAAAAVWMVPDWPPLIGVGARAGVTAAVYAALLGLSGFFRASERAFLRELAARFRLRTERTQMADRGE
jgi:O-antigen/teichoic acid export membrane protein